MTIDYATQTDFSDPGPHAPLLAALPPNVDEIAAVVRNVIVHYRSGVGLPPERISEIDHRWVSRILDTDQARHPTALAEDRTVTDRTIGCCRDFTLLTVAALRAHGIPARSRIGFGGYLGQGWHYDHVVVELMDERRPLGYRMYDAQLDPAEFTIDTTDLPRTFDGFASAADVWTAYRRGEIDIDTFGVDPHMPFRGAGFVSNYVLGELAHRLGDELLLWDIFGAMGYVDASAEVDDAALIDEIAALLIAADGGDDEAEAELGRRYATDERVRPGRTIRSFFPTGVTSEVDLTTRTAKPLTDAQTITINS